MPDKGNERRRLRPLWSGTISFGLVSLPVSLFTANRGRAASLRLVDEEGTPLTRRYFCPVEGRELESDEIVRGYEYEKDSYVMVSDDELEALAPDKTQEIDLRRFVDADEIEPVYFERAYFLAPDKGGAKAYRLLAQAMAEKGRAGVATFVMRGKEYLVAIIAESGILRAEILRFGDELRRPADIGLPELREPRSEEVDAFLAEMESLAREELDEELLVDEQARRLRELVAAKLATGDGVVTAPDESQPDDEEGEEFVDLMRLLKESLAEGEPIPSGRHRGERATDQSKAELYEQAKELGIPGRGNMSKQELLDALGDNH